MIGKLTKGSDAAALMSYLLGGSGGSSEPRPRADLIGGTFSGQSGREIAAEFGQLRRLRPRLGRHVAHVSLSLPPDDREVSDAEWSAIADHWTRGMGFEAYAVVSHGDHVHVAASRIRLDGSVVSDSHDWRRSESLVRDIEARWGLRQVESSHLLEPARAAVHRLAPSAARLALAERGIPSPAEQLADLVDAILDRRITAPEFIARLEAAGIGVRMRITSAGRLAGFSYEIDGTIVTAKALGRGYTLQHLVRRGLEYDQAGDFAELDAARQRAAHRGIQAAPDDLEHAKSPSTREGAGARAFALADAERPDRRDASAHAVDVSLDRGNQANDGLRGPAGRRTSTGASIRTSRPDGGPAYDGRSASRGESPPGGGR